ncbi:MAG: alkane 1-monooxygenase [Saprospiraceae bacterium]|nr:alkane 1-monooxygenase [Saprospiraceae bacterium]
MAKLKYLLAYIIPLTVFMGLYFGGWYAWSTIWFAFIFIPILELFVKAPDSNFTQEQEKQLMDDPYYDILLYLNLPILYGSIAYLIYILQVRDLELYEHIGMTLSVGILGGTLGINVAHELGHKESRFAQFISKCMLLPTLYMHFFIEHNRGHHKYVATKEDPATAIKGETIYSFFIRSTIMSYLQAWKLEHIRLSKFGKSFTSLSNAMIQYTILQLSYVSLLYYFFGLKACITLILVAIVSFLLLEAVNYIEHYGLMRNKNPDGTYQRVSIEHSWNSNHELGRIFLYELTRHSDHHYNSLRPYQVLRHHNNSPQLPYGYPMSILIALIPSLWFKLIHKELNK